jgi:hypothetical protein
MEKIIVYVHDREKAARLLDLLASLDFVASAALDHAEAQPKPQQERLDFFELAGLWQNRNITAQSIRKQAWPRQHV